MIPRRLSVLTCLSLGMFLFPTRQVTAEPASATLANPASVNCIKSGGVLTLQKRGDGGEYGICNFEDNRQCEEWALLRGQCPPGGLKITGYTSPAQIYCVIQGGKTTANPRAKCETPDGRICENVALFDGHCPPKP